MDVNLPDVVAEVTAEFDRYEAAFQANDIDALDELFWNDPLTVRYGAGENLYSHAAIASFRGRRSTADLAREILVAVVTTFGRDLAVTSAEFRRTRSGSCGRQSQTWVRTDDGWRIVTAHVSELAPPPATDGQGNGAGIGVGMGGGPSAGQTRAGALAATDSVAG